MAHKRKMNPISELTKTWGMEGLYWIRIVVYAMFVVFVLFFILIICILLS